MRTVEPTRVLDDDAVLGDPAGRGASGEAVACRATGHDDGACRCHPRPPPFADVHRDVCWARASARSARGRPKMGCRRAPAIASTSTKVMRAVARPLAARPARASPPAPALEPLHPQDGGLSCCLKGRSPHVELRGWGSWPRSQQPSLGRAFAPQPPGPAAAQGAAEEAAVPSQGCTPSCGARPLRRMPRSLCRLRPLLLLLLLRRRRRLQGYQFTRTPSRHGEELSDVSMTA